jgi:hypothetical protein
VQDQILKDTIEQTQKIIKQSKDWQINYDEQVNAMLDNRTVIDQFRKSTKEYETYLQFYLTKVKATTPDLLTITTKYKGTDIATVTISKDQIQITTDNYNKSNKELFNCDIQLKQEEWNSLNTKQFLEHYKGDIKPKGTLDNKSQIESMLLAEFSKNSSYNKLLTGIQPIKYGNLFYPIPINIKKNEDIDYINILTRTKVRKLTIIENIDEAQTSEAVLAKATSKAIFLFNLLHAEQGQQWYKVMGFHGRVTPHLTIKVCIAVPKKLATQCKEFKPFTIETETDSIEYHYMTYDTDGAKMTSIKTTLNE